MTYLMYVLLAGFIAAEIYYWFVYFPRAWRDRSNREINMIRDYVEYRRGNPRR